MKLINDKYQQILALKKNLKLPKVENVQIPKIAVLEEENHSLQSEVKQHKLATEAWTHKVEKL